MFKFLFKLIFAVIFGFLLISVLTVILYKYVSPPITPIMVIRVFEGVFDGKNVGITKSWKSYDDISPYVFKAILSGEDAKFMKHNGFDWDAIENAKKFNESHKGVRKHGASTVSMQTSKNAFLWHGRNYVRKALEAYFTVLIENIWGKKRILEVYANIIEWGDGIYGIEAASQTYFNKSAIELTKHEAALLAAVIPNPRRWSPANPTEYIKGRQNFIEGRMAGIAITK